MPIFQHYLTKFGSTVAIPLLLAPARWAWLCVGLAGCSGGALHGPPPESASVTLRLPRSGALFGHGARVTVRVGPGMTLQPESGDPYSVRWGCFRSTAPPGSARFFADRDDCWLSTYVAVDAHPSWPAAPTRWLYPEETLVEGVVSQHDAYVASVLERPDNGSVVEVRVRVARRNDQPAAASGQVPSPLVCTAGKLLVPGEDVDVALQRVRGMCGGFRVEWNATS